MSDHSQAVKSAIVGTFKKRVCFNLCLAAVVFIAALGAVYVKDLYRHRFIQLEKIKSEQEQLQTEWSQLLLEEGTWAAHARILEMAKDSLQMRQPTNAQIQMLTPGSASS